MIYCNYWLELSFFNDTLPVDSLFNSLKSFFQAELISALYLVFAIRKVWKQLVILNLQAPLVDLIL